jgi:hypothetical protein
MYSNLLLVTLSYLEPRPAEIGGRRPFQQFFRAVLRDCSPQIAF